MYDVHASLNGAGRSILLVARNYFRALTNKETPVLQLCLRQPADTNYREARLGWQSLEHYALRYASRAMITEFYLLGTLHYHVLH